MVNGVAGPPAGVSRPGILSVLGSKVAAIFKAAPELALLSLFIIAAYVAMQVFSKIEGTEVLSATSIWAVLVASFILSTAIAIFAVIAGIGGGVIYTPLMLGFTSIDTLVIRSTGLVVAMFSGLISTGPFMRKGLSPMKLVAFGAAPICLGALIGSTAAIMLEDSMGETGDSLVRLLLGIVMVGVAVIFIKGGAKYEYPELKKDDKLATKLGFNFSYWEESLGKEIHWRNRRIITAGILLLLVGLMGGFFGLGGGWALTPLLNIVMGTPLKVAAASSGVLLAISDGTAAWGYIKTGAMIPVFVAPWLLGQVVGGVIGAHLLSRIRVSIIRYFVISVLVFAAVKLLIRAIEELAGIDVPVL